MIYALYWQYHIRLSAQSLLHSTYALAYNMSKFTIERMIKNHGLRSKITRKYKYPTDSNHRLLTASNYLDSQFIVAPPNKI